MGMMNGNGGQEEYEDDGTAVIDKSSEKERDREDKSQGQGTPGKTESPLNTPSQVCNQYYHLLLI